MSIADRISELRKNKRALFYYGCFGVIWLLFAAIVLQKAGVIFANGTPQELREMNTVVFADSFAHGKNLYAVSNLESQIPVPTSMYGFLVPLALAPFIRLFSFTGLNSLQICQLVTLAVEIVGVLFFYRLIYRKTGHGMPAVIGMVLFYYCYWRFDGFGGAFPDQWGMTLSVILMDMVCKDRAQEAYRPGLYAEVILGLFYIKQYFVFAVLGLCVWLFLRSKKAFGKLALYGIGGGLASILLTYLIFPLYFSEALPIGQGQTNTSNLSFSLAQIKVLNEVYKGIIVFGVIYLFIILYQMIKSREWKREISYEFCQLVCILPFTIYIAQNGGTTYTYYLQLWYPYVVACGIIAMNALMGMAKELKSAKIRMFCYILSSLAVLFSFNQMLRVIPFFKCYVMTAEEKAAWENSYQMLDEYAARGDILVPALLSNYCLENDLATADYGQAQYNSPRNLENYRSSSLWPHLFLVQYTEKILENNIQYNNVTIKKAIADQKYSCIALTSAEDYWLAKEDVINAGYSAIKTENLPSGGQRWEVTFYAVTE